MHRPQPTHVTDQEGDCRVSWAAWQRRPCLPGGKRAHAVTFDDGTVFDLHNGWRELSPDGWRRVTDKRIDGTGWAEAAFSDDVDPKQREPVGMTPTEMNDAFRRQMEVVNRIGHNWVRDVG